MNCCNSDKPSEVEGFPQREWSIEVYMTNDKGDVVPANLFDKVTYHLHPSFGSRATQSRFDSILSVAPYSAVSSLKKK